MVSVVEGLATGTSVGRDQAARTVAAFSARLRDEVDVDALVVELLAVADQAMQPTMVSLWLRPSPPTLPGGQWRTS
jgi:hypothetical protein